MHEHIIVCLNRLLSLLSKTKKSYIKTVFGLETDKICQIYQTLEFGNYLIFEHIVACVCSKRECEHI